MQCIAPLGPVYQAGTLSGNPVAVAAGLATLKLMQAPGFFERLSEATRSLARGLQQAAHEAGVSLCARSVGGMFGLYFAPRPPRSYAEVMACDRAAFNRFFHAMLRRGRVLRAISLRGGVRLGRAHRRRHRSDASPPRAACSPGWGGLSEG